MTPPRRTAKAPAPGVIVAKIGNGRGRYYRIHYSAIHRRTGLSVALLSRIFAGERAPTLRTLDRLAFVLGQSLDELRKNISEGRFCGSTPSRCPPRFAA